MLPRGHVEVNHYAPKPATGQEAPAVPSNSYKIHYVDGLPQHRFEIKMTQGWPTPSQSPAFRPAPTTVPVNGQTRNDSKKEEQAWSVVSLSLILPYITDAHGYFKNPSDLELATLASILPARPVLSVTELNGADPKKLGQFIAAQNVLSFLGNCRFDACLNQTTENGKNFTGGMIGSGVAVNFSNEFFNPPTPVSIPVHGFNHGQRLRMVVVPTHNSSGRFAVNLKSHSDILLHFNPRFDERAVVRNSTHHGHWQHEERHCEGFPFQPNRVYTLEFISSHGQVEVLLNGQLFCSFAERAPGHDVSLIEIEGDVVVHSAHVTH